MLDYLPECISIRGKLEEWIQEVSTCFYFDGLMIRCIFCIPWVTLEFIIPRKNQLTCIVFKINYYDSMIKEQNCISAKTPVVLVEGIANKDAAELVFLEHGIHDSYHTTKLLIFVSFGLLV